MIPAGYLLKRVVAPPEYLADAQLTEVCSVADCVNDDVVDVQEAWEHNGFGVANDAAQLWRMAAEAGADVEAATLFYYEVYEQEIESDGWSFDPAEWRPLTYLDHGQKTSVTPPSEATVFGFDVVVFENSLDHSPLSCNHIAAQADVNQHCLFETLESAKSAIDAGIFGGGCEPGVYRIFSVAVVAANAGR
ncbi:hypothetical protein [Phenylobacterium sp. CCH12-B4]|uniref:hypothetical protein n=3 Tax=unclassified Phenylobacterium TaxID=2640670 RepID=UPI00083B924E|nr:hypothetical protein [Phenylobacterium sp. CCH12-B4]